MKMMGRCGTDEMRKEEESDEEEGWEKWKGIEDLLDRIPNQTIDTRSNSLPANPKSRICAFHFQIYSSDSAQKALKSNRIGHPRLFFTL